VGHPLALHLERSQLPEKGGHKLAFYLEESQPPGESSSNLDFSANDIANESLGNGAFDNEEFEQTSVVIVGSNGSWFKVICDHCKSLLVSGNFWYTLIFGLLPTAWDTFTDLGMGEILEQEEDFHSAAACWMLVCLPPVECFIENMANRCKSTGFQIAMVIIGASVNLLSAMTKIV
jgi:hypothetical protein